MNNHPSTQNTAMPHRDISHYHEFVPKETRPIPGSTYRWYFADGYVYTARVVEFRGGCWATVEIIAVAPEYEAMYSPGTTFEIKVAHYKFEPAEQSHS
jgi:hypothetical protein